MSNSTNGNPFLIPSLRVLEDISSPLTLPSIADPDTGELKNLETLHHRFLDAYLLLSSDSVRAFLYKISPCLMSLLLAGYNVTAIEICPHSADRPDGIGGNWIKLDIRNWEISLSPREVNHADLYERGILIKMQIETLSDAIPLASSDEENLSDGFFEQRFETFETVLNGYLEGDERKSRLSGALYKSLRDYLMEPGFLGRLSHNVPAAVLEGSDTEVFTYRKNQVEQFLKQLPAGVSSGRQFNVNIATYLMEGNEYNNLWTTIEKTFFDSLTWYVLDKVTRTCEERLTAFEGGAGDAVFQPALPGILSVFDADKWKFSPHAKKIIEFLFKIYFRPSGEFDLSPADKRKLSTTRSIEDVILGHRVFDTEINRYSESPLKFFLEQQCLSAKSYRVSNINSIQQLARASIEKTYDTAIWYNNISDNGPVFSEGRSADTAYLRPLTQLQFTQKGIEPPANIERLSEVSYLEFILYLMNRGVLEIDGMAFRQNEFVHKDYIEATYFKEDGIEKVEIKLKNRTHSPLILSMTPEASDALGQKLFTSCCWEYIEEIDTKDYPDMLNSETETDQDGWLAWFLSFLPFGSDSAKVYAPKLFVVAGPGVKIENHNLWPTDHLVEIFRVQSPSLVPGWGERIQPELFMQAEVIEPFDYFDHELVQPEGEKTHSEYRNDIVESWDENRLRFWFGDDGFISTEGDILPSIKVQPFSNSTYCGVAIIIQPPKDTPAYKWRGGKSPTEIVIQMKVSSDEDRFAYDFFPFENECEKHITVQHAEVFENPDLQEELREKGWQLNSNSSTGYGSSLPYSREQKIISFDLVIYKTSGVEIRIKDSGIDMEEVMRILGISTSFSFADLIIDTEELAEATEGTEEHFGLDRNFRYHFYKGSLGNIPSQGGALNYEHIWVDSGEGLKATPVHHSWYEAVNFPEIEIQERSADFYLEMGALKAAYFEVFNRLYIIPDILFGILPYNAGDVIDLAEFIGSLHTKKDKWGRPITFFEQSLLIGGVILPYVTGSALKAFSKSAGEVVEEVVEEAAGEGVQRWVRHQGDDGLIEFLDEADEVLDELPDVTGAGNRIDITPASTAEDILKAEEEIAKIFRYGDDAAEISAADARQIIELAKKYRSTKSAEFLAELQELMVKRSVKEGVYRAVLRAFNGPAGQYARRTVDDITNAAGSGFKIKELQDGYVRWMNKQKKRFPDISADEISPAAYAEASSHGRPRFIFDMLLGPPPYRATSSVRKTSRAAHTGMVTPVSSRSRRTAVGSGGGSGSSGGGRQPQRLTGPRPRRTVPGNRSRKVLARNIFAELSGNGTKSLEEILGDVLENRRAVSGVSVPASREEAKKILAYYLHRHQHDMTNPMRQATGWADDIPADDLLRQVDENTIHHIIGNQKIDTEELAHRILEFHDEVEHFAARSGVENATGRILDTVGFHKKMGDFLTLQDDVALRALRHEVRTHIEILRRIGQNDLVVVEAALRGSTGSYKSGFDYVVLVREGDEYTHAIGIESKSYSDATDLSGFTGEISRQTASHKRRMYNQDGLMGGSLKVRITHPGLVGYGSIGFPEALPVKKIIYLADYADPDLVQHLSAGVAGRRALVEAAEEVGEEAADVGVGSSIVRDGSGRGERTICGSCDRHVETMRRFEENYDPANLDDFIRQTRAGEEKAQALRDYVARNPDRAISTRELYYALETYESGGVYDELIHKLTDSANPMITQFGVLGSLPGTLP